MTIYCSDPYNVSINGVTIANSASHSIHLAVGYKPDHPDDLIRWVKIFTWRANGDGLGSSGNQVVEDCFVRTQDDAAYVGGRGMRRVVFWLDSNGCVFILNHIGTEGINAHPLVIEDISVVYVRTKFPHVGGNIFDLRGVGEGEGGYTITFRNLVVEDPRPTHQAFKLMMQGVQPWGKPDKRRGPGDLYGITFQNISIKSRAVMKNEPELLWGMEDGLIYGLIFDNVTIGNETVEGVDFFHHNEYVFDDLEK